MYNTLLNTLLTISLNPIALRKAKIACDFGLSEYNRVNIEMPVSTVADDSLKYFLVCFSEKNDLIDHVNPVLGRGFT